MSIHSLKYPHSLSNFVHSLQYLFHSLKKNVCRKFIKLHNFGKAKKTMAFKKIYKTKKFLCQMNEKNFILVIFSYKNGKIKRFNLLVYTKTFIQGLFVYHSMGKKLK